MNTMYDCDTDVRVFQNDEVTLNNEQQAEMRDRRGANRNRLKKGLEFNDDPVPCSNQAQGSYAMHTMVQDDNNDYDIDDGAVFPKTDLVGKQGAAKAALDARKMVCAALDDGSFSTPPTVMKNCVRVFYKQGYHVDIPVYRQHEDGTLELASSVWKGSSPSEVSEWYNDAVCQKSPDTNNSRQLRRITRLIKYFTKSRESWKSRMASGLAISVLVVECYVADQRDDISFVKTIKAIRTRLQFNLEVVHPVRNEMITHGNNDPSTKFLCEKLDEAIDYLQVLFNYDCSRLEALKSWKRVYPHQFWRKLISDEKHRLKEKSKQEKADLLRKGNAGLAVAAGLTAVTTAPTVARVKQTEAYGGKKSW